jgi:ankyrin repeat protein
MSLSIFDKDTYPSVEEIEILIQEGMDINSVDEKELTSLLHLAGPKRNDSENLFEIFRILIQNGADINCKNKDGKNVLHLLCEHYKKENLIDLISLLKMKSISIRNHLIQRMHFFIYWKVT